MRVGIFGGTFNPPHLGHLLIANRAAELASLERVIIMPAATPPHKDSLTLATAEDRLKMCELMFDSPLFTVSDMEILRGGKSYSYDTLCELKKENPDDELVFIIGSDMLLSFEKWYRYKDILNMCTLCVFSRDNDITPDLLKAHAKDALGISDSDIFISSLPAKELSSTQIREAIAKEESLSDLVSENVEKYIYSKKAYVSDIDRTEEFRELCEKMLHTDRYIHSLGVAGSAKKLAALYGENEDRAYCAGLLHDITKHTSDERQIEIMTADGVELTDDELANKSLWHAMSAASFLKTELNVKDKEIISAVRYHTTGKAGMTLLEKIVYIADFISPERNYPDVDVMRKLSYESLDKAALYALRYCIGKLLKSGKVIHTDSISFYNELILKEDSGHDRT